MDSFGNIVGVSYADSLKELATACGISLSYRAIDGQAKPASEDTLIKLLRAMGVKLGDSDHPSEAELQGALNHLHDTRASRPLPPTVATVEGTSPTFNVHVHHGSPADVHVELEDGSRRTVTQEENWTPPREVDGITWGEATFRLPDDLPTGYHRIHLHSGDMHASARLIVSPARLNSTDCFVEDPRFGVMAQLYSVRSEDSWGIGDFHDAGELAARLAQQIGADFLLINPLHAAEPVPPIEDSPYLPTTRRFINPIYIRIEDIPEYADLDAQSRADIEQAAKELQALNRSPKPLVRNEIYSAKLDSLHAIHAVERSPERVHALTEFRAREGQGLEDFARWCAEYELEHVWAGSRHLVKPSVEELVDFNVWLQFICDEQLAAAQARALEGGMKIGLVTDLAVGVHPGGADAQTLASWLAGDASVGAPPDPFNQQGQDWSQPPWNPLVLAEAEYEPWRAMLQTVLRHAGGIRVDHVIGLFRLFWMPRMQKPATGAYINYDYEAMLGVLTLEAQRAGAIVIGEDLGTFEPWVQDVLANRGVMGTSVLWFEHGEGGGPRAQSDYRSLALASVGTHDLPPTSGYLQGTHITLRSELGLLETDLQQELADDKAWQNQVLSQIVGREITTDDLSVPEILVLLHDFMAGTPAALMVTNLVDLVGDTRTQNQPGTNCTQYPNWRIPLTDAEGKVVLIEDLANIDLVNCVGKASQRH